MTERKPFFCDIVDDDGLCGETNPNMFRHRDKSTCSRHRNAQTREYQKRQKEAGKIREARISQIELWMMSKPWDEVGRLVQPQDSG